jgi:hypothetical protein
VPELRTIAGQPVAASPALEYADVEDAALERDVERARHELAMSPLEHRAEVESFEMLLFKQRAIARELAPLDALFGGEQNAFADARRKQHRQWVASQILAELRAAHEQRQAGEHPLSGKDAAFKQPSEAELERLANSDPRHLTWCDNLEQQRAQWSRLSSLFAEYEARIENRRVVLQCYANGRAVA